MNNLGIDPKWAFWLGIIIFLDQGIGSGSVSLKYVAPEAWIPYIQAWAGFLAWVLGAVQTAFIGFSSKSQGPLTPALPGATKLMIILAVVLTSLVTFSSGASAQQIKATPAQPAALAKQPAITKTQAIANPAAVLQTFASGDLQAALDDATANNDNVAIACYTALLPIVQKGTANPLPKGLGAFQALQKARNAKALIASLSGGGNSAMAQLNIACAPLVMEAQNTLIQLGILGGTVAATGGLGLTLPIALPFPLPF